jgi:hypothetical protein
MSKFILTTKETKAFLIINNTTEKSLKFLLFLLLNILFIKYFFDAFAVFYNYNS